jgi:hypothetical protein
LTSLFNDSIHQLVAAKERCTFFHENGRENRNHGNQEKGKEEKEALSTLYEGKRGRQKRPLSFCPQPSANPFCRFESF